MVDYARVSAELSDLVGLEGYINDLHHVVQKDSDITPGQGTPLCYRTCSVMRHSFTSESKAQ